VAPPERPRVYGISHMAFRVSDLSRARAFYEGLLGLPIQVRPAAAGGPERLLVSVNDRQYLELLAGLRPDEDRLDHVALETEDVEAMYRYLTSRGLAVPRPVSLDPAGPRFALEDPEGHVIEMVQHAAGGWSRPSPAAPTPPVSLRILHAGILVSDLPAAQRFYAGVLGFSDTWRGSRSGVELSWTNMKVPDGEDYLEFMLHAQWPAPDARGTAHHACLEVPDVEVARARLLERAAAASYSRPLEARVGTNRRRQLNLFDPDGTRVELMEPHTVDGQPVPSSTATPPRRR
jgi:catechol 2,3-dioxygenase-like lactoylglutathione lyase family enzyme